MSTATLAIAPDGAFSGHAAIFAKPDLGGDVIQPGAFAASLARGPAKLRLLFMHDPKEPIGFIEMAREDTRGLFVRGRLLPGVQRAREVHALVTAGALDGLSIGFKTVRSRRDPRTGLRILQAVDLWEISLVTFPMMPEARLLRIWTPELIGKKYDPDQPRDKWGKWTAGAGVEPTQSGDDKPPPRPQPPQGRPVVSPPRPNQGDGGQVRPGGALQPGARGRNQNQGRRPGNNNDRDPRDQPDPTPPPPPAATPRPPRGGGLREREAPQAEPELQTSPPAPAPDTSPPASAPETSPPASPPESESTSTIPGGEVDLTNYQDDAVKDHAIPRHAHGDPARLEQRMEGELARPRRRNNLAFSTFDDIEAANRYTNQTLEARSADVREWLSGVDDIGRFEHEFGTRVGSVLVHHPHTQSNTLVDGSRVRVVLERDATSRRGWRVLTSYILAPPRQR